MILKVGKKEKENQAASEEAVLEQETAEAVEPEKETAQPEEQKPSQLEELQKANADLSDKLLRQMAEFDNFRKRTAREKEEIGVVAKSKCIAELLPVLDNFERAMMT